MRGASIAVITVLGMTTAGAAFAQSPPTPPSPPASVAPPSPPAPVAPTSREAGTSAAPLTPVPAPTPAEVRYRRMSVDVETTRPNAVLERRVSKKESVGAWLVIPWRSQESTWEQVCIAPCRGADLDRYSTYRVAEANRISGSRPFTLPQGGDTVHLRLDAGSQVGHRAGQTMAGIGGAALVVGSVLLAVAPTIDKPGREHDYRVAGAITGSAGLVLLAIGVPLALLTTTSVYADNELRVAREPPRGRFTGTGFTF